MRAPIPADGDVQSSRQSRIGSWTFNLFLQGLVGLPSPFELVLAGATGKEMKVTVAGAALPKLREAWKTRYPGDQTPEQTGELKFADDGKIARMTIRQFGGYADPEAKKGLRPFYKESFETIHTRGSKALIIDLRNNGGGEDELGQLLLSYLIDQPFKYYDDLIINARSFDFSKYTGNPVTVPEKMVEARADGKFHAVSHPNWGIK